VTLQSKILVNFGIVLAVAQAANVAALLSLKGVSQVAQSTVQRCSLAIEMVGRLDTGVAKIRLDQRGLIYFAMLKDMKESAAQFKDYETAAAETHGAIEELRKLLDTDSDRALLTTFEQGLGAFEGFGTQAKALVDAGKFQDAAVHLRSARGAANTTVQSANELKKSQRKASDKGLENIRTTAAKAAWISVATMLLLVPLAAVLWSVIRGVVKHLRAVSEQVSQGSQQLQSAAGQMCSASDTLARSSSEQAASLEETSASTEQITAIARQNASNSGSATDLMARVDQEVGEANSSLDAMVSSMQDIGSSSEKVAKIIKVIDGIAFQTNILALNAAVESARAGEAGMGFAVVADEVRNLAQRSAQAARDTAALVEESIAHSQGGRARFEAVAKAIRNITQSASSVKKLVDAVSVGSNEQTRGVDQIAKAILALQGLTQSTAASAEEVASSSEELNAQAASLESTVRELNGMIGS
jgi:methyl-accepting chemotaxis protein